MKRLTILSLTLLLFGVATTADAQTSRHDSPAWWQQVTQQTVANIQSPYEDIRLVGLKNIVLLTTQHRDKLQLDEAVQPIIEVCETYPEQREMALAALQAISSSEAVAYLKRHLGTSDRTTSRAVAAVLKEHYKL